MIAGTARHDAQESGNERYLTDIYGHALSRYEVNALINADRNLRLAEQFSTVNAAISSTRKRRFDVVVIDVSGPEKNGLEIFCDFKQACPSLPVLVINGSQQTRRMLHYLRLGCKGYLPYTSRSEEVIPAIRCLARGKQYALKRLRKMAAESHPLPHERLSMRELQILFKLSKGRP